MLTARDAVADRVAGLDAGADDYLTKPFSIAELLARVRALVRRGAVERPTVLRAGDLTLDPTARSVQRGRKDIELTAKEFALLEYLMMRADEVVTRTELLEKVWDFHFDPGSNVVDVHVARLRAKLRLANAGVNLDTVRGIGFIFTARDAKGQVTA